MVLQSFLVGHFMIDERSPVFFSIHFDVFFKGTATSRPMHQMWTSEDLVLVSVTVHRLPPSISQDL
jgi:hypothetical protein